MVLVLNPSLSRAGSPSREGKGRERFPEAKEADERRKRGSGARDTAPMGTWA